MDTAVILTFEGADGSLHVAPGTAVLLTEYAPSREPLAWAYPGRVPARIRLGSGVPDTDVKFTCPAPPAKGRRTYFLKAVTLP